MFAIALPALLSGTEVSAAEGLSPALYRRLSDIREQMEEGKQGQGIERLRSLLGGVKGDGYAEAVIRQHLGYGYLETGDPAAAQRELAAALELQSLPAAVNRQLQRLLAQVALQRDRPKQALVYLQAWMEESKSLDPQDRLLAAQIHYAAGMLKPAIRHLELAIDAAARPPEGWRRSLLGMYLEAKRPKAARRLLRGLIRDYPAQVEYWRHLSQLEALRGRPLKALSLLAAAYRQGLLEPKELTRFAQMHAAAGIPERAARLLRQWRTRGKLRATDRRLQTEAELWLMAREGGEAKGLLRTLAQRGSDGRAAFRLGCILFEEGHWAEAADSLELSLTRGGLPEQDQATLLLGIAAAQAGRLELAEPALARAVANPATRDQAEPWLVALGSEKRVGSP